MDDYFGPKLLILCQTNKHLNKEFNSNHLILRIKFSIFYYNIWVFTRGDIIFVGIDIYVNDTRILCFIRNQRL